MRVGPLESAWPALAATHAPKLVGENLVKVETSNDKNYSQNPTNLDESRTVGISITCSSRHTCSEACRKDLEILKNRSCKGVRGAGSPPAAGGLSRGVWGAAPPTQGIRKISFFEKTQIRQILLRLSQKIPWQKSVSNMDLRSHLKLTWTENANCAGGGGDPITGIRHSLGKDAFL